MLNFHTYVFIIQLKFLPRRYRLPRSQVQPGVQNEPREVGPGGRSKSFLGFGCATSARRGGPV